MRHPGLADPSGVGCPTQITFPHHLNHPNLSSNPVSAREASLACKYPDAQPYTPSGTYHSTDHSESIVGRARRSISLPLLCERDGVVKMAELATSTSKA